ncbi:unnamed protein product [Closterium sp. NIES-54]
MYAVSISDEGDCYRCFSPDPGIETAALGTGEAAALGACEAAALGASASASSGTGESALSSTALASASLTFTLESGASRSFFRDRTTLTPLSRPVAVSLADPSGGPVLSHFSTVLPCPAAPSGTLSGLYLPSFSTNLVSGADLQDGGVHQFTPARQRVTHYTEASTGRHLATFTRQPGSSLYTLTTASPLVAESGRVAASGQVFAAASRSGPESAPCSCRLLSHETLLWHHRLGHPSVLRLRGMASRLLVSGLPRSLPPLPQGPGPTYVPCVEGCQRAAPHSSQFPPTEAPLQTLHMDVWGPACVRGQGHDRYFLLVVDDYSRYTAVFPLHSKGDVTECRARGIRQTFTLPDSPQQNGIAERRIGMVMDVARTSMMHAAAPHFMWPFAVRYAAHQINLHPRVSSPETSPALLWTGKVGDASAFRVWGSRAFVHDLSADNLSPRAAPCVFLGFPPDAPGWQFYHPTSRRVLSSQDVTFNESVPYYRLFPYRTPSLPPPPLFLVPGPPPVDPLPPQGPSPSGVSQVDAVEPVEVTGDSGAAEGAEPGGADSGGAERRGAEPRGAEPGGAEPGGAEPGGAEPGGAEPGGALPGGATPGCAEPRGAELGGAPPRGSPGASSLREPLSPQELREWFARRSRRAAGAGGSSATEGAVVAGPGGARTGSTGAAGPAGSTGAGASSALQRIEELLANQLVAATAAANVAANAAATPAAAAGTPTLHPAAAAAATVNLEAARPRLPETFNPNARDTDVRRFVATLEIYFEAVGCTTPTHDAMRIRLAATLLRGPALEWIYNNNKIRGEGSWTQFREALIQRFEPINSSYMARQQIHRHKQFGSVTQYTQQMESLFNRITDLTEGEKIQAYTEGLKMEVHRQVIAANYNNYRDLVSAAERFDALIRYEPKTRRHTIYGYSERQQPLLLEVICNGRRLKALVDSGASHSVCDHGTLEKIGEPSEETNFTATMVDGTKLSIHGEASLQLHIGALRWKPTLPITNIKGLDFILGRDFLKWFNPEIDWVNRKARIYNNGK